MIESKFGRHAQPGAQFKILDANGKDVTEGGVIQAGVHVVHGPWKLVTKDQVASVVGVVTPSMCNTEKDGQPVFEFQGNGWRPQGSPGDVLLMDVANPKDRWACKPEIFQDSAGWKGTVQTDGAITYAKPGKPLLAIELPEGIIVVSLESGRAPSVAGCLLSTTKADKGDFYVWTPDVVSKYVRDYVA